MAAIDDLIADRLAVRHSDDPSALLCQLDLGLLHAGKMVEVMYDQVVHPALMNQVDTDAVAATGLCFLAFLGSLAQLVDALEQHARQPASRPGQGGGQC